MSSVADRSSVHLEFLVKEISGLWGNPFKPPAADTVSLNEPVMSFTSNTN